MKKVTAVILRILMFIIFSFILHMIAYSFDFTLEKISNVLFISSLIGFFVSLIFITNASRIFRGFGYAVRVMWTPSFRAKYPKYRDYLDAKGEEKAPFNVGFEILIESIGFFIISLILILV